MLVRPSEKEEQQQEHDPCTVRAARVSLAWLHRVESSGANSAPAAGSVGVGVSVPWWCGAWRGLPCFHCAPVARAASGGRLLNIFA